MLVYNILIDFVLIANSEIQPLKKATILRNFEAKQADQLDVKVGDIVEVDEQSYGQWLKVSTNFHSSYMNILSWTGWRVQIAK